MGLEQFQAIMPVICADLAHMIAEKQGLPEIDAIKALYDSALYAALEQEETKVWQYSTPMLYTLFVQEQQTGNIRFPDV